MKITNAFYQTLMNKKREIPFWMWWIDILLVAIAGLASSIVRILTLGMYLANWDMDVMFWSAKRQIERRIQIRDAKLDKEGKK
jgi:hypothetical protein